MPAVRIVLCTTDVYMPECCPAAVMALYYRWLMDRPTDGRCECCRLELHGTEMGGNFGGAVGRAQNLRSWRAGRQYAITTT